MKDIDGMVKLGAEMHAASIYAARPYVPAKLAAYGRQFLNDPKTGVCILAEEDDTCHGMMAGWAVKAFFNDEVCAREMMIYVRPEKRGGMTAIRMLSEFEGWAKEIGATEISVSVSAGIDNDRATRFYKALGYQPRGVTLAREISSHG